MNEFDEYHAKLDVRLYSTQNFHTVPPTGKKLSLLIQCSIPSQMISNFSILAIFGIGHFEFCHKMLYFINALALC